VFANAGCAATSIRQAPIQATALALALTLKLVLNKKDLNMGALSPSLSGDWPRTLRSYLSVRTAWGERPASLRGQLGDIHSLLERDALMMASRSYPTDSQRERSLVIMASEPASFA